MANRYLTGNYAPVAEEVTIADLGVSGKLPPELSGRYLRNGPNPALVPEGPHHWFSGDGMLHGVEIRDGKASWYRNRWVQTDGLSLRMGTPQPGEPWDVSPGNPANTNVIGHAGRILALCEAGLPYVVSPELDTVGRTDFAGKMRTAMTAHPKTDPATGELLFFGYAPFPPYLTYHVVDAQGGYVRGEAIDLKGPSMVHDFAITETRVLFFDLPVVFDLEILGETNVPYRWKPEYGARVGVMPRDGGNADVKWFDVEPCYVFHPMNAFDDGDCVVVDVVRWPTMFAESSIGPFAERGSTLDRWTIDIPGGNVKEERLSDRPSEFPRVDERLVGRQQRYGYAAELVRGESGYDQGNLLKYDLSSGALDAHPVGKGRSAGEGIFIPRGDGEDDGYVMAMVHDLAGETTDLVILDAGCFGEEAIATVRIPRRVPFGFHGNWIPD